MTDPTWAETVLQVFLLCLLCASSAVVVGRWLLHTWCLWESAKLGFHEAHTIREGGPAATFLRPRPWMRAFICVVLALTLDVFTCVSLWVSARYLALNPALPAWFAEFLQVDQTAELRAHQGGDGARPIRPNLATRQDIHPGMLFIMITSVAPSMSFLLLSVVSIAVELYRRRKFQAERARATARGELGQGDSEAQDPHIVVCVPCYNEPYVDPKLWTSISQRHAHCGR